MDTLQRGAQDIHRLDAGAQQVASGADRLATASGTARDGASELADGVGRYTDGVSTARSGADDLASGARELYSGADRLADGVRTAQDGAQQLADGSGRLASGAAELADGAGAVDDGARELSQGAETLNEGAGELADGSAELRDGLEDAKDEVPSYTDEQSSAIAATASDPVQMDFVRDHELTRFGEGLAPLFLAISLWVGAMAIFLMMPPFSMEAAAAGAGPVRLLAGGLLPALALGLVQSAIAVAVLHGPVGITVTDLPLMLGMAALTSAVFVALNHGFGALFGPVGKFVALVLVALQISAAGGTYPTPTLPGFFRAIHPYLPMTHAVDAFRGAIGGSWIDPADDLTWLGAWMAIGVALGLAGAVVQRRRAMVEDREQAGGGHSDDGGADPADGR
ncbi:YhgE/Pip family protein [Brachybacterium sp. p3-SID957]|nr:YhgE/Pip family protein [Brachybacterium sp. p3-SID957]